MPIKRENFPEDKLALYEKLVAETPGTELKANFGFPYTAINGNMYSLISKTGSVGIRLGKEEREAFLEKYDSVSYEHMPGAALKEYVTISDEMLRDTQSLIPYLRKSLEYTSGLKPKPTKKKKK